MYINILYIYIIYVYICTYYIDVGQRRVGKAAERAGTKYASSVIYHSKRLIGCKYGEKVFIYLL
jgi:hypothetical protein